MSLCRCHDWLQYPKARRALSWKHPYPKKASLYFAHRVLDTAVVQGRTLAWEMPGFDPNSAPTHCGLEQVFQLPSSQHSAVCSKEEVLCLKSCAPITKILSFYIFILKSVYFYF